MNTKVLKIDRENKMPVMRGRGRPPRYPFADMNVGDTFFVDEPNHYKVYSAAYAYGRYNGKKFIVVKEGHGTRVGRVA